MSVAIALCPSLSHYFSYSNQAQNLFITSPTLISVSWLVLCQQIYKLSHVSSSHANKVDTRNILIPQYAALCEREDHLTLEEGEDIGMETLVLIARGHGEVQASCLASDFRRLLTPTIQGEESMSL